MPGSGPLDQALAVVMLCTAGYHGLRLLRLPLTQSPFRVVWSPGTGIDLTHLVMGVAMAFMLIRPIAQAPTVGLIVTFSLVALWFGWWSVRLVAGGAGLRVVHSLQHGVMSVAMVAMLAAGRSAAGSTMAGMSMATPDAARWPLATVLLVGMLLVLSVWNLDQLAQARSTAPRALPAGAVRPGAPLSSALSHATVGAVSCRLAMCLVMGYLLVQMG